MLRRTFLKLLGLGVPAAMVLPALPVPVDPYEGVAAKALDTLYADIHGGASTAMSDRFFMVIHPSQMEPLINVGALETFKEDMRDEGCDPDIVEQEVSGTVGTWKGFTFIESANLPAEGLTLEKVQRAKALLM